MYVQVSPHTLIPPGGEGNRVYHVLEVPGEKGAADLDEEGGGGGGGECWRRREERGRGRPMYTVPVLGPDK